MANTRVPHYNDALKLVRYLKGTPGQGILYSSDISPMLEAYCDTDGPIVFYLVVLLFHGRPRSKGQWQMSLMN